MNYKNKLIQNINNNSANIGIIGLGYVGLPLACIFAKSKFNVFGFDIDKKNRKIKKASHI